MIFLLLKGKNIMVKYLLVSLFFIFCIVPVFAYVVGDSNLSIGGYPEFDKWKPQKPYSGNDEYSWKRYYDEVNEYTAAAEEYIDNASNDIKRIQEAIQEAVDKANSVVSEANRRY